MAVCDVVAILDPLSTGGYMAADASKRGHPVMAIWTRLVSAENRTHVPDCAKGLRYLAEVEEEATIEETAAAVTKALGGRRLAAMIVGADDAVTLADELSLFMGLRSNGVFAGGARRNKNVQNNAVKATGLRAVREALGTEWHEVSDFVDGEPLPIVVKPVESAGSDGVKLCTTRAEVREHFELLMSSQQRVGAQGAAVLCQEFLKGNEYVIDQVSRDGVHKTIMVWVYDKRPANGSAFVYYGMLPVDPASAIAQQLITYTNGVLDALQLNNGPSHGEVMMTADGPCMVEMNCRCAGADGSMTPLAKMLTGGYAQPDASLDAYLDCAAFNRIPLQPASPFKAWGQQVALVSFYNGTVRSTPGYDSMRRMTSFVALQTGVKVGSKVDLTIDVFTLVGFLVLAHTDAKAVEADVAEVRRMERENLLFTFDEDVDPAQCYPSIDTVVPDGRRRSSTMDSTMMQGEATRCLPAASAPADEDRGRCLVAGASAVLSHQALAMFAVGILCGVALGRRSR